MINKAADNRFLIRRGKIRRVDRFALLRGIVNGVDHRCLEPAERKIIRRTIHPWVRKRISVSVALRADFINADSSGIRQAHCPAGFIQRLSRSVITGLADDFIIRVAVYGNDVRMPAADNQAQKRRLHIRSEIVCRNMGAKMVNGHQRLARGNGKPLGKTYAHKQSADQPGRIRYRNGVYIPNRAPGIRKRLRNNAADCLRMAAGRDLRHNAAVQLMLFQRRRDHI